MKPPLDQMLKERFAAQYMNVAKFQWEYYDSSGITVPVLLTPLRFVQSYTDLSVSKVWILLRSIESLSDAEAIEVAKIWWDENKMPQMIDAEEGKWIADRYLKNGKKLELNMIDYLRSIGICLPFMGYSVEELVEAGWVRIKGEEGGVEG